MGTPWTAPIPALIRASDTIPFTPTALAAPAPRLAPSSEAPAAAPCCSALVRAPRTEASASCLGHRQTAGAVGVSLTTDCRGKGASGSCTWRATMATIVERVGEGAIREVLVASLQMLTHH